MVRCSIGVRGAGEVVGGLRGVGGVGRVAVAIGGGVELASCIVELEVWRGTLGWSGVGWGIVDLGWAAMV